RLGPCLVDDQVGLAHRLRLELGGGALGQDEGRAQERLQLAEALEVGLELFDLVGEVCTVAPDLLEARDDLLEHAVGRRAAIAEEAAPEPDVADLDGCECHLELPSSVKSCEE